MSGPFTQADRMKVVIQCSATKQIAFAILVENGQYGGASAAPMASEIVAAARELGLL